MSKPSHFGASRQVTTHFGPRLNNRFATINQLVIYRVRICWPEGAVKRGCCSFMKYAPNAHFTKDDHQIFNEALEEVLGEGAELESRA